MLLVVVCLGTAVVEMITIQEQTADLKLFCLPWNSANKSTLLVELVAEGVVLGVVDGVVMEDVVEGAASVVLVVVVAVVVGMTKVPRFLTVLATFPCNSDEQYLKASR